MPGPDVPWRVREGDLPMLGGFLVLTALLVAEAEVAMDVAEWGKKEQLNTVVVY